MTGTGCRIEFLGTLHEEGMAITENAVIVLSLQDFTLHSHVPIAAAASKHVRLLGIPKGCPSSAASVANTFYRNLTIEQRCHGWFRRDGLARGFPQPDRRLLRCCST